MKYLYLLLLITTVCVAEEASSKKKDPNIILIMTDDQDALPYTLEVMTKLRALITDQGATFTNSFVNNPLCCPSRAGTWTGQYMHNHGVVDNEPEGNCGSEYWVNGPEKNTFPVLLNKEGYTTFYAGKYMNNYAESHVGGFYVPPGWTHWYANQGNSKFYNYYLSANGTSEYHGNASDDYITNVIEARALDFIKTQDEDKKFFMVLCPSAPHYPFTYEEKYKDHFSTVSVPRTPNFNIENYNKNWYVQFGRQNMSDNVLNIVENSYKGRLRSLMSVDDMVESVVQELDSRGFLENTYIIYTSDHGYHTGQFSIPLEKSTPYEMDIRVPLLVRGPGISAGKQINYPAINIDLAPTILDFAGIDIPETLDGVSLKEYLSNNDDSDYGRTLPIEHKGQGYIPLYPNTCPGQEGLASCFKLFDCKCSDAGNNTYSCLRTINNGINELYCEWEYGFKEYYDIDKDPYQLDNAYESLFPSKKFFLEYELNNLRKCSGSSCP